jgi:hypothetical protein
MDRAICVPEILKLNKIKLFQDYIAKIGLTMIMRKVTKLAKNKIKKLQNCKFLFLTGGNNLVAFEI